MVYFYSGVVSMESQIVFTLPNVYKYSYKHFSRVYFKMTNILFSAKTNVLAISIGVTLTNKSLLFLYNTHISIDSLPFVPILLACALCCVGNNSMVI